MSTDTTSSVSTLSSIQQKMVSIGMPILLVLGSGGNILNSLVFLQKKLRSNSCSMYLIASSITHTLVLSWAMSTSLYSLDHTDPLTFSQPYCKIRQYLISAIFSISRFCLAMACVDRYAICSRNARIRAFGQPRIACYVIVAVVITWLILPVHLIVFNTIVNGKCIMPGLYPYFFAGYAVIIAAILRPSIMIIFGLLTVKSLRHIRQRVQPAAPGRNPIAIAHDATGGNTGARIKQHDYQLLKILLVDVSIYCISAVPSPIYYIYAAITLKYNKTAQQIDIQNFLSFLANQFLLYISASASLYSNTIVSKTFRHEFRALLTRYYLPARRFLRTVFAMNDNNIALRQVHTTIGADAGLTFPQGQPSRFRV